MIMFLVWKEFKVVFQGFWFALSIGDSGFGVVTSVSSLSDFNRIMLSCFFPKNSLPNDTLNRRLLGRTNRASVVNETNLHRPLPTGGDLGFSVGLFTGLALLCILTLIARRRETRSFLQMVAVRLDGKCSLFSSWKKQKWSSVNTKDLKKPINIYKQFSNLWLPKNLIKNTKPTSTGSFHRKT